MLKKILVPIDGSEQSFNALKYASSLCKDCGSKLVVSTVVFPYAFTEESQEYNSEMVTGINFKISESKDKAGDLVVDVTKDRILELAKKKLVNDKEIVIEYRCVISNDPAKAIVDQAEALKVDTIVMGNRGMGQFAAVLLGSVGSKVISFATCPVVIVK